MDVRADRHRLTGRSAEQTYRQERTHDQSPDHACESSAIGRDRRRQRPPECRAQEERYRSDAYGRRHRQELGDHELLEVDAAEEEDGREQRQRRQDQQQHESDGCHQFAPDDAQRAQAAHEEYIERLSLPLTADRTGSKGGCEQCDKRQLHERHRLEDDASDLGSATPVARRDHDQGHEDGVPEESQNSEVQRQHKWRPPGAHARDAVLHDQWVVEQAHQALDIGHVTGSVGRPVNRMKASERSPVTGANERTATPARTSSISKSWSLNPSSTATSRPSSTSWTLMTPRRPSI